jgi:hypothetical protein
MPRTVVARASREVELCELEAVEEVQMPQYAKEKPLSTGQRMEVFRALVEVQDAGMSLPQSRQTICQKFAVNERQLKRIEREGLDANWPPLG